MFNESDDYSCLSPRTANTKRLPETLKNLVRMDTRSGSEGISKALLYLESQCRQFGLECSLQGPQQFNNLIVSLKSSDVRRDGLILLSHLDTADWDEKNWDYHPLSAAQTSSGLIYGRGTIDCKSLVAIWLNICVDLLLSKENLKRDIYFVVTSDEETGGEKGVKWLLEYTDIFDLCCTALNEGGGAVFSLPGGHKLITCQHGEKGRAEISVDGVENKNEFVVRRSGLGGKFKYAKARYEFERMNRLFGQQTIRPDYINALFDTAVVKDRKLIVSFHHKSNPTELLKDISKQQNFPLEGNIHKTFEATVSPLDSELFKTIKSVSAEFGFGKLLPIVTRGISDSRFLRGRGIDTYGFLPFGSREDLRSIHSPNECIHRDSLGEAYLILKQIVMKYCLFG
ncbi:MAG: M20/M25/M40 family metallo-hydrolase [Bacteroidales bacterium]|nr:M20/M25/M40 family metallo-hydrolase [Bacteroidales bacterium]